MFYKKNDSKKIWELFDKMKIAILGRGISGTAAAHLAEVCGYAHQYFCDGDDHKNFADFDLIVVSPGIAHWNPLRRAAKDSGIPVISELEFGAIKFPGRYLAITGTNGKTTTTELTVHLLNSLGIETVAAGNIGAAFSDLSAEVLKSGKNPPLAVVEVSSFQLELTSAFAPDAAAILNLASDHLDRYHDSLTEYGAVKGRVFANTLSTGRIIGHSLLNCDTERLLNVKNQFANRLTIDQNSIKFEGRIVCSLAQTNLRGNHNLENLAVALELVRCVCGLDALFSRKLIAALKDFKPGQHRLEIVLEQNGITFINDSKATNPHAVNAALKAVGGNKNVHLILGGLDKGMDFETLNDSSERIKTVYIMGECRDKIQHALQHHLHCIRYATFDEAILAATTAAKTGEIVMLSPACASMDMFKNYRERGERFRSLILASKITVPPATTTKMKT